MEKIKTRRNVEVPLDKSLLLPVPHLNTTPVLALIVLVDIHIEPFLCIYILSHIVREKNGVLLCLHREASHSPKNFLPFTLSFPETWPGEEGGWMDQCWGWMAR